MNLLTKLRIQFGWTASPEPEFLRFKAEAGALPPLPAGSANAPMLAELLKKNPAQVTWDEIQAGRMALVAVMSPEALQARFDSLSNEYETVTGNKPFAQGTFSNPPKSIEGWRAGVISLIEELAKFRRARLMFERVRSTVSIWFGLPLLGLFVWCFYYVSSDFREDTFKIELWKPLLFAGLVGAGFSVLSRLYSLTWTPRLTAQVEDSQALKKGLVVNCVLSLTEGVIAASVIYLLFSSGLLKGDLFPAFDPPGDDSGTVFYRFVAYEPTKVTEVAKLLAWAFMAGFAERLVPDKLNQLAGQQLDSKRNK